MEMIMKKIPLLALAILIASTAFGIAAPKGGGGPGASEMSPGDRMRDAGGPKPGARGASEFAPGDTMRDSGGSRKTTRGASEFSPGDKMNDKK
jgi:hypothetical protein